MVACSASPAPEFMVRLNAVHVEQTKLFLARRYALTNNVHVTVLAGCKQLPAWCSCSLSPGWQGGKQMAPGSSTAQEPLLLALMSTAKDFTSFKTAWGHGL
jgi:hypothetical protein